MHIKTACRPHPQDAGRIAVPKGLSSGPLSPKNPNLLDRGGEFGCGGHEAGGGAGDGARMFRGPARRRGGRATAATAAGLERRPERGAPLAVLQCNIPLPGALGLCLILRSKPLLAGFLDAPNTPLILGPLNPNP